MSLLSLSACAGSKLTNLLCVQLMYISKKRYAIERLPDQALG